MSEDNKTMLARDAQGVLVGLLPAAAILANINNLGKRLDGMDQAVHSAAMQCAMHAMEHGDVMLADRLVKTLGGNYKPNAEAMQKAIQKGEYTPPFTDGKKTGYYAEGLTFWFKSFTPITWNGDGKPGLLKAGMGLYIQLLERNAGSAWNLEAAEINPFWTMAEVRRQMERAPFTLESVQNIVINLKDRITKSIDAGTFKGDKDAALAYIDRLTKVELPPENEDKVILPTAPNVKGTTYKGPAPQVDPEHQEEVVEPLGQVVNG